MKTAKIFLLSVVMCGIALSCNKSEQPEPIPVPTVNSISTTSGSKGSDVTVNGTDFPTDMTRIKVSVNGVMVSLTSANSTSVTFTIPRFSPAPTSPIPISVFIDNKEVGKFNFTYLSSTILISITNGQVGYADGTFADAKIEGMTGITIDSNGNVYMSKWDKPRVRKITLDSTVSTMAGDGTWGYLDAVGTSAKLGSFDFCASDPVGNIYVAESNNQTGTSYIRKIDTAKNVTTFAAYPESITGQGIKVGKSGTIYISCWDRIGKVSPSGVITWLAISAADGDLDGSVGAAKFRLYGGIEVSDDETKIYVSDYFNGTNGGNKVKLLDLTTNTITTIAGKTGLNDGDGNALEVGFKLITCTLLDKTGGLYIADGYNSKLKYLKNGQITTIIGSAGPGDADGNLSTAKINLPHGLAINTKGEIFISCVNNNKLKKIITE